MSLSEYDHSPRVSFSVLVGCLGSQEAFSLILEVPYLLSFSFLFLVQEELEYSWPFAPVETVVKEVVVGTAERKTAETGIGLHGSRCACSKFDVGLAP